ncbi:hypothetical protein BH10CHL1_BH10CHL1_42210 [soil metagenome]
MAEFVTYKRWRLKDGKGEADLVELVRNAIVPHYAKLAGDVRLGLHRIRDTQSYLVIFPRKSGGTVKPLVEKGVQNHQGCDNRGPRPEGSHAWLQTHNYLKNSRTGIH